MFCNVAKKRLHPITLFVKKSRGHNRDLYPCIKDCSIIVLLINYNSCVNGVELNMMLKNMLES
jgi:hypothetical protein